MLPKMAIIMAPTQQQAKCLMDFLDAQGIRWAAGNKLQKTTYWDVNKGASCYRLNHSEVTFGPKTFYEKKHFAAYGDWYMISVDDFISRCTEGGGDELVAVSLDAIL